ncbi:2-oxo acid dehydrogenase subunit E2 [Amnibacterium kyonggiense]|uniref:2-oxoacid dehydrogenase/acyltransferase catalytic subunit n=1 Tax=Amnibacterium kyonggiense TaxID=595671 RepID=A0A4R7FKK3_9MICO|nr:2-oxo acid dehydrogenase subunit E2 [Amnibacterium kyonggiense]TDS76877.1 2-oxoacid dehydrogenase/acyltransferase catalytic subunit [Amnibacterium kyonggiense]
MDRARERVRVVRPLGSTRRVLAGALRAGRRQAPMTGLLELDVTTAEAWLRDHPDRPVSMTAFVTACVARAAQRHPEVHAYRTWAGRIAEHRYVDVAVLVETATPRGPVGLPRLLVDADARSVEELTAELRSTRAQPAAGSAGRLLQRTAPVLARIPGATAALYLAMARSPAARRHVGTVSVTAVGMFGGGGGFGIAPPTVMPLAVVVGGIAQRPRVVDGGVEPRWTLDLTVAIDHAVVDGAPAARFCAELRRLVETAGPLVAPEEDRTRSRTAGTRTTPEGPFAPDAREESLRRWRM